MESRHNVEHILKNDKSDGRFPVALIVQSQCTLEANPREPTVPHAGLHTLMRPDTIGGRGIPAANMMI